MMVQENTIPAYVQIEEYLKCLVSKGYIDTSEMIGIAADMFKVERGTVRRTKCLMLKRYRHYIEVLE